MGEFPCSTWAKPVHVAGYKGNCVVKISAMGETEMHELGFRCAQFRIDEVYVQDASLAEALRERLGIDIFIEEAPCESESENSASPQNLTQTLSEIKRLILLDAQRRAAQQCHLIQPPSPSGDPFVPLLGTTTSDHTHTTPILTAEDMLAAKKKLEGPEPVN